jgi:hypothetical protein
LLVGLLRCRLSGMGRGRRKGDQPTGKGAGPALGDGNESYPGGIGARCGSVHRTAAMMRRQLPPKRGTVLAEHSAC